MGWTGYEATIPAGMLIRRMYCSKCGSRLEREKVSKLYHKGETGYQNHLLGHGTIGMDKIVKATYIYKCPKCENVTTYDEQIIISKIQKKKKTKILSDDDIK